MATRNTRTTTEAVMISKFTYSHESGKTLAVVSLSLSLLALPVLQLPSSADPIPVPMAGFNPDNCPKTSSVVTGGGGGSLTVPVPPPVINIPPPGGVSLPDVKVPPLNGGSLPATDTTPFGKTPPAAEPGRGNGAGSILVSEPKITSRKLPENQFNQGNQANMQVWGQWQRVNVPGIGAFFVNVNNGQIVHNHVNNPTVVQQQNSFANQKGVIVIVKFPDLGWQVQFTTDENGRVINGPTVGKIV